MKYPGWSASWLSSIGDQKKEQEKEKERERKKAKKRQHEKEAYASRHFGVIKWAELTLSSRFYAQI